MVVVAEYGFHCLNCCESGRIKVRCRRTASRQTFLKAALQAAAGSLGPAGLLPGAAEVAELDASVASVGPPAVAPAPKLPDQPAHPLQHWFFISPCRHPASNSLGPQPPREKTSPHKSSGVPKSPAPSSPSAEHSASAADRRIPR